MRLLAANALDVVAIASYTNIRDQLSRDFWYSRTRSGDVQHKRREHEMPLSDVDAEPSAADDESHPPPRRTERRMLLPPTPKTTHTQTCLRLKTSRMPGYNA